MDELIKVRLATIIDCEGSIGIYNYDDGKNKNKSMIHVSQNDKKYLQQFKDAFGFGNIEPSGKKGWQYEAGYIQALIICVELVNYLQLKRDKALKVINFYILKSKNKSYNLNSKLGKYGYTASFIREELDKIKQGK